MLRPVLALTLLALSPAWAQTTDKPLDDFAEVQLPPDTWRLVRSELDGWSYTPLLDPDGQQVIVRDLRVEWGEQLRQGSVREALDQLHDREFFTVRYAEVKDQTPTGEFARVTGARLSLGTYVLFQYKDRLLVFRWS